MDQTTSLALTLAIFPLVAVVGIMLNLVLRARGGRSLVLRLRGFGIDLTVETHGPRVKTHAEDTDGH